MKKMGKEKEENGRYQTRVNTPYVRLFSDYELKNFKNLGLRVLLTCIRIQALLI